MVVRMRSTHAHTRNRRSHHALGSPTLIKCECGALHVRHRACMNCGRYRARIVIDVAAKAAKRSVKVAKRSEAQPR